MTTVLMKIAMLGSIVVALALLMDNMPNAQPLPEGIATLILWLFNSLYFFDAILNVPVFIEVVIYMCEATIYYFIIRGVMIGLGWMFRSV